jgi:hypothetical protein
LSSIIGHFDVKYSLETTTTIISQRATASLMRFGNLSPLGKLEGRLSKNGKR